MLRFINIKGFSNYKNISCDLMLILCQKFLVVNVLKFVHYQGYVASALVHT